MGGIEKLLERSNQRASDQADAAGDVIIRLRDENAELRAELDRLRERLLHSPNPDTGE